MLVIRDTNTVPPEDWTYYVQETNFTISTKNYTMLYPTVVQHCQSNNVSVPTEQAVIDQLCRELHIPCYESENAQPIVNKFSLNLPVPIRVGGCCGG